MRNLLNKILGLDITTLSAKEKKRVILVNSIVCMGLLFSAIFIVLDIYMKMWEVLYGLFGLVFICVLIYVLNRKGKYALARTLLVLMSFSYTYINANYLFTGKLAEFFHLMTLLMVMLLTDKLIIHLCALFLLLIAFYVPNIYMNHYPDDIFGYANISVLFIALFLTIRHFIHLNKKSEQLLIADNLIIERQKSKLEELQLFQQQFFINISHEIRTPLTLINGNLNRINKADHQFKSSISNQTKKITRLLDDLIDLSKIDSKELILDIKPTNISQLVYKSFQMFESHFENLQIDFKIELSKNESWALVDEVYFERCLANLVHNASKFTEQYGSVIIRLREIEDQIEVSVEDSGIGIQEDETHVIFNRFSQLKTDLEVQGTGVGLNFVKECMELMKGEVQVESEFGKGTYFTLVVPKAQAIPVKPVELKTQIALHPKIKLLLVDDHPEMISYLKEIFKEQQTLTAHNGKEALKILEKETIDCVITDFMMPEMDGLELLKNIKTKAYETSVVILTAKTDSDSRLSALRLGVDDYLNKPFIEEELILRINTLITNHRNRLSATSEENNELINKPNHRNSFLDQIQEVVSKESSLEDFMTTDLAEELNMSASTLLRTIKMHTGLTTKQYLKEVGLQRARTLYEKNTESSVKVLAKEAGIRNQTYFAEEFYKRFGISLKK